MKRILAIASCSIQSAVRSRVVAATLVLVLAALLSFPLAIEGDGTITGQVNISLHYTLSVITFLLSIITVWLGCAAISQEIQYRQIHLISTKPVRAYELWMGKWLGVLTVNAGLLFLIGVATLIGSHFTFHPDQLPSQTAQQDIEEIWRARQAVPPVEPSLDDQINTMVNSHLASNPTAERNRAQLEQEAHTHLLRKQNLVAPQQTRTWTFPPLQRAHTSPLKFSYRLSSSSIGPNSIVGHWSLTQHGRELWSAAVTNLSRQQSHLFLPSDPLEHDTPITLTYKNQSSSTPVVFAEQDTRLHLHRHSMDLNLFKALVLIFFNLAFLAAVGVTAGAAFSLPVAALISGYVLLLLQAGDYIQRTAQSSDILQGSDGWQESAIQLLFRALHLGTTLLKDQPILPWLAEGVWINPAVLLYECATKVGVYASIIGLLGVLIYKRREIGLPS